MLKILIVNHNAPYNNFTAQESLEMALAFSAYEHEVSLAFVEDGVFQLVRHQKPDDLQQKSFIDAFHLLEPEGIINLWVEAQALTARGLTAEQLWSPHQLVNAKQLRQIMHEADHVFHF